MPGSCFADILGELISLTPGERGALDKLEERQRHLRRGAVLQRENEPGGELFILRKGLMMSYVLLDDGSRQILRFLFPGDMIGVSSAVYHEATETLAALSDCVVSPFERAALADMLAITDLFMPSGPELFLFTRATEEQAAVAELLAGGIGAVVVKRGAEGASYFDASGAIHAPALAVDEVDPTGAGDSFGGAFVTCWLRGLEPRWVLAIANAAGACAVRVRGPMEGTSTMAEVDAILREFRP